jgi:hypothetical protein
LPSYAKLQIDCRRRLDQIEEREVCCWPTAPTGGDRFVILPKVGSARNADVNSLYYRFRAQSGNGARSSKPVTKWKSRPTAAKRL